MTSLIYDQSSVLIVGVLFVGLVLGIEAGYRISRRSRAHVNKSVRTQINAIQASMLGMIALLLGFTFSQSLERHDARSEAVVDEANAIGTAYLRAQLAPPPVRDRAPSTVAEYLDLRVEGSAISLDHAERAESLIVETKRKQAELWEFAKQAAAEVDSPVTSGLFIQSVNELIDSFGRREAEITRHVPELVVILLMFTCVLCAVVVGVSSGADNHRPSATSYTLVILIVLLVFVVIDLDRPRRGLIEVPQASLVDLQRSIQAENKN